MAIIQLSLKLEEILLILVEKVKMPLLPRMAVQPYGELHKFKTNDFIGFKLD